MDPVTEQPIRTYLSSDVQSVDVGTVYPVDVEIWPTNVVVEKGGKLGFEIAPADTQGSGIFLHNHPEDRYSPKREKWLIIDLRASSRG